MRLTARIWITDPDVGTFITVRSEYVKSVKQRFDDTGIEIPYPQVDLTDEISATETAGSFQAVTNDQ